MGLDYRVWRVLLVMVIISLGLLGYRFMEEKKCKPVSISIKSINEHTDSIFLAGETLTFIALTEANDVSWDFGDHSAKESGQYIKHQYQSNGVFYITASTGKSCEATRQITIKPITEIQQKADKVVTGEEIIGPSSTFTGKEEMFSCMVSANTYDWSIPNYPKMVRTGPSAKFQFPGANKYIVQVTLDQDRTKRYSKEITVEDPPKAKVEMPQKIVPLIPGNLQVKKTIKIADNIFRGYLEKVVNKEMKVEDFDDYLCDKGDTKTLVNGRLTTFAGLCEEISGGTRRKLIGKRKIKIDSAVMRRDGACVSSIEVQFH